MNNLHTSTTERLQQYVKIPPASRPYPDTSHSNGGFDINQSAHLCSYFFFVTWNFIPSCHRYYTVSGWREHKLFSLQILFNRIVKKKIGSLNLREEFYQTTHSLISQYKIGFNAKSGSSHRNNMQVKSCKSLPQVTGLDCRLVE